MVGELQTPPGTQLFDCLKKDNRLLVMMISGDNVDGTTNIKPKMGLDQLKHGWPSPLPYTAITFGVYAGHIFFELGCKLSSESFRQLSPKERNL
jgi:hypothetical protein